MLSFPWMNDLIHLLSWKSEFWECSGMSQMTLMFCFPLLPCDHGTQKAFKTQIMSMAAILNRTCLNWSTANKQCEGGSGESDQITWILTHFLDCNLLSDPNYSKYQIDWIPLSEQLEERGKKIIAKPVILFKFVFYPNTPGGKISVMCFGIRVSQKSGLTWSHFLCMKGQNRRASCQIWIFFWQSGYDSRQKASVFVVQRNMPHCHQSKNGQSLIMANTVIVSYYLLFQNAEK